MSAKKLQRWYQQVWSGFTQALENGEIGKDNLQVNQQGERQEIAVPIFEEKNMDPKWRWMKKQSMVFVITY